jgi:hypothetical protein
VKGCYTLKKGYIYIFQSPAGMSHIPNSPWSGIHKVFPARESLVSDFPAGEGKMANLFYIVDVRE